MRRLLATVLLVSLVGCASNQPAMDTWLSGVWRPTLRMIPVPSEVTPQACEDVLGQLRERASSVRPAPFPELGDAAEAWLRAAETLMFDCAADRPDFDYQQRYSHLAALAEEVDTVIRER